MTPLREVTHALVTGAAGAIGGAVAAQIARCAPGAKLTLVDRDAVGVEAVAQRLGGVARIWDLADVASLPAAWHVATEGAPVDLLVNCAGVMDLRTLAGTPWDEGERLLAIDLLAPLRLMALAAPAMQAEGRGAIVNVSSLAGLLPLRGAAYYGAAKAGLAMASEVARLELAGRGVHVVTVYPGPVASGLEQRARAQVEASRLADAIPTGRAEDLARLVVEALEHRRARVVYPSVYRVATAALGIGRRVTARYSPWPLA